MTNPMPEANWRLVVGYEPLVLPLAGGQVVADGEAHRMNPGGRSATHCRRSSSFRILKILLGDAYIKRRVASGVPASGTQSTDLSHALCHLDRKVHHPGTDLSAAGQAQPEVVRRTRGSAGRGKSFDVERRVVRRLA